MTVDLSVFEDLAALSHEAARCFVVTAREAVLCTGRCSVALSGGRTPVPLFELLATEYRDIMPWEAMDWYWVDERAVPPDHPESNFGLVWDRLLSRVPVAPEAIHRMEGEAANLDRAARRYEATLRTGLPDLTIDLALLGVGDDGHTASLFPGSPVLSEATRLVRHVRGDAALPVPDRLTLTLPALARARTILVLAAGASKRPVVEAIQADPELAAQRYPIARVRAAGHLTWLVDEAAAGVPAPRL